MDNQVLFFVVLSVAFIYNGTVEFNPVLQMSGILFLLFLIYDVSFNKKRYNLPKPKYKNRISLAVILGNLDLIFGSLILLDALHGIIPHVFLSVVAVLVLMKALFFVFCKDIASIVDTIVALLIIFDSPMLVGVKIAIVIYFMQKGALTYFFS